MAYHLRPKVPVLFDRLRRGLAEQIPYGTCSCNDTKRRSTRNPYIEETGREIIAIFADRTPSLVVAACRLPEARRRVDRDQRRDVAQRLGEQLRRQDRLRGDRIVLLNHRERRGRTWALGNSLPETDGMEVRKGGRARYTREGEELGNNPAGTRLMLGGSICGSSVSKPNGGSFNQWSDDLSRPSVCLGWCLSDCCLLPVFRLSGFLMRSLSRHPVTRTFTTVDI